MIDIDDYGLMSQGTFEQLITGTIDQQAIGILIEYHETILALIEKFEDEKQDLQGDISGQHEQIQNMTEAVESKISEFEKRIAVLEGELYPLKALLREIISENDKRDWAGCESVKYLQSCAYSNIIAKIQKALENNTK
jgi:Mg2+ and Co2+ transporter CorA